VYQEVCNLPGWAYGDAATFFGRAEQHERANGRYATQWQIALPRELDRETQITMSRDFLQTHLAGHAYLWVLHDPIDKHGNHQPHLHVMFSERRQDGIARGPAQYFRRYNARHPERGGCQKDRWFHERSTPAQLRESWCDWANYTLERAGCVSRVDPRSLYDRGIDRKPQGKRWGSAGVPNPTATEEQHRAAGAWEQRKQRLGLADCHDIPPHVMCHTLRHHARSKQPGTMHRAANAQDIQAAQHGVERQLQTLSTTRQRLQDALEEAQQYRRQGTRIPPHRAVAMRAMVREDHLYGRGLTMSLDEERQVRYGR
jgi:hypothetical protein